MKSKSKYILKMVDDDTIDELILALESGQEHNSTSWGTMQCWKMSFVSPFTKEEVVVEAPVEEVFGDIWKKDLECVFFHFVKGL